MTSQGGSTNNVSADKSKNKNRKYYAFHGGKDKEGKETSSDSFQIFRSGI